MTPATSPFLLGIDIGSTVVKAVVTDCEGRDCAIGRARTPWSATPMGIEADAGRFLEVTWEAVREALDALDDAPVVGVGVSSLAESLVLLGAAGVPVAPVIAWYDERGVDEVEDLREQLGADRFSSQVGLPVSTTCSVVKLAWLRRHVETTAEVCRALSVAEWVVHALGGEQACELSLASRTGVLDVVRGRWWAEPLDWAGYPTDLFPSLVLAGTPLGVVDHPPAGLEALRGACLTVAGHDHLCAAAGAGVTAPGQLFDSCGTAEGFLRSTSQLTSEAMARAVSCGLSVSRHVLPDQGALIGGHPFGRVLAAVRDLLGGIPDLGAVPDGVPCRALPDVQGLPAGGPAERLHLTFDHSGVAVLSGIMAEVTPADAWRAAAHAVLRQSFAVYEHLEAIGGPVEVVVLTGGWADVEPIRLEKVARFPSTIRPVYREAGSRGAALFGGSAAGLLRGPEEFPKPAYEAVEAVVPG